MTIRTDPHGAYKVIDEYGTVEEIPYIGDTAFIVHATCSQGDWENQYKGHTIEHGYRSMMAHYKAKHQSNVQMPTPTLIKLGKLSRDKAKRTNRGKRSRGKFPYGTRVMGEPGKFGKVVGHSESGSEIKVWWDSGKTTLHSPSFLTVVPKERL